ncbi:MAG: phosphotransferase [Planctomycetota bacterium]
MTDRSESDLAMHALAQFCIDGEPVAAQRFRRGHIQRSYVAETGTHRYLLQRLNDQVFPELEALSHNVAVVTDHLAGKGLADTAARPVRSLGGGLLWWQDPGNAGAGVWRCLHFVDETESHDLCDSPERAFAAARAFGEFQQALADLDPGLLQPTLPDFFDPIVRHRQLETARAQASSARLDQAQSALGFVDGNTALIQTWEQLVDSGSMPDRVLHGDTKLNNVLFRRESVEAVCVVDLDTCMSGWSGYDIGDLVRFTAASAPEDERDLSKVFTDLDLYRSLVAGYLTGARFLTKSEVQAVPLSSQIVTMTIGMRFLADFLNGDQYFAIDREGQNLDRARVQFRLVESMQERVQDLCDPLPASVRAAARELIAL